MFTLTREEVRELDRRAIHEFGVPGIVLMENAGRGCAELLMRLNPQRATTCILCGPGNNGGDGFVIARHLDNAGWPVRLLAFAEPNSEDAKTQFQIALQSRLLAVGDTANAESVAAADLPPGGWFVDALFGTGLSRALAEPYSRIVQFLNDSNRDILAIDIPSGLDCDTGEPLGSTVKASRTATFVAPKRGFQNPQSREWTGEVHVIDIGAPRCLVAEYQQRANT
jgi:NAD(P)H-hydrate epimerase